MDKKINKSSKEELHDLYKKWFEIEFVRLRENIHNGRDKYFPAFRPFNSNYIFPTELNDQEVENCFMHFNKYSPHKIGALRAKNFCDIYFKAESQTDDFLKWHNDIGFDGKTFYYRNSYGEVKGSMLVCIRDTDYLKVKEAEINSCMYNSMDLSSKGTAEEYIEWLKNIVEVNQYVSIILGVSISGLIYEFIGEANGNTIVDISSVSSYIRSMLENLAVSVFGSPRNLGKSVSKDKRDISRLLIERVFVPFILYSDPIKNKTVRDFLDEVLSVDSEKMDCIKSPIIITADGFSNKAVEGYRDKVLILRLDKDNRKLENIFDEVNKFTKNNYGTLAEEVAKYLIDSRLYGDELRKRLENTVNKFKDRFNKECEVKDKKISDWKLRELFKTSGVILLSCCILEDMLKVTLCIDDIETELIENIRYQCNAGLHEAFDVVKNIIKFSSLPVEKKTDLFDPSQGKIGYEIDNNGVLCIFVSYTSLRKVNYDKVFNDAVDVLRSNKCLKCDKDNTIKVNGKRCYYIIVPNNFKEDLLFELENKENDT